MCCGCGRRCVSSSRPRCRCSRTWTPRTPWSCWAGHRTRTGPRRCHGEDRRRAHPGEPPRRRREGPADPGHLARTAAAAAAGGPRCLHRHRRLTGGADQGAQHPDRRAGRGGGRPFGQHPYAEIYASQPGLGVLLGARVLAEFGDDPHRFADAKARKNYAGTSPITRASGTRKIVLARYARNRRLADALQQWAFCT